MSSAPDFGAADLGQRGGDALDLLNLGLDFFEIPHRRSAGSSPPAR